MKLVNMDESMKGMVLLNDDQISLTMPDLLLISVLCLFSHRFEVFKGLKIDTVLRNFTVFEYTKDKVSLLMLFLLFCSYSWQFVFHLPFASRDERM